MPWEVTQAKAKPIAVTIQPCFLARPAKQKTKAATVVLEMDTDFSDNENPYAPPPPDAAEEKIIDKEEVERLRVQMVGQSIFFIYILLCFAILFLLLALLLPGIAAKDFYARWGALLMLFVGGIVVLLLGAIFFSLSVCRSIYALCRAMGYGVLRSCFFVLAAVLLPFVGTPFVANLLSDRATKLLKTLETD